MKKYSLSEQLARSRRPLGQLRRVMFPEPVEVDDPTSDGRLELGRHSYHHGALVPRLGGPPAVVRAGNFCSLAQGSTFLVQGHHHPEWITTSPLRQQLGLPDWDHQDSADISIGDDVWIGREALIFGGVSVGTGAIVGARAVVTSDVEPYAIVAGVPAKLVRKRFSEEEIAALLNIRWWEWPDEKIIDNLGLLSSPAVSEFIATHA